MDDVLTQIDVDFAPVRSQITTDRTDVAQSHIGQIFVMHSIEGTGGRALNFVHSRADLGALSFNRLGYGAELDIVATALPDFYLFQITLQGELVLSFEDHVIRLQPGSIFVMNPGVPYRKHWNADSRQLLVRIPVRMLERRLMHDLGITSLKPVRFAPVGIRSTVHVTAFLRQMGAMCQDLADAAGVSTRPFVADALEALFLSMLLAALPHDSSEALTRPPSPAAPYYVNRAEHYMRNHARRDVSMADLSVAAGVTDRTLQEGFRRFRGAPPMQVLRNIRLDMARDELMRGLDVSRTVTDVAIDSGFSHLGRFAKSYADRFGEAPSETLRRRRSALVSL